MRDLSSAIVYTLRYGDMFQYPYTEEELISWLPVKKWPVLSIRKALRILIKQKKIFYQKPYYGLYHHKKYIQTRCVRKCAGLNKIEKANGAASILRFIPTITLIGITGGLALSNADDADDIDWYVGVKPKTVWISRLLSAFLLEIMGIRRRPGGKEVKDAFCLNMFVSENNFTVSEREQDIFTAHEVLQMQPIMEKNNAYQKFLKSNKWVSSIFPSKWEEVKKRRCRKKYADGSSFSIWLLRFFETPVKYMQLWYMKNRRTHEKISDTAIQFHPHDVRLNIRAHHLPLDKNFFRT